MINDTKTPYLQHLVLNRGSICDASGTRSHFFSARAVAGRRALRAASENDTRAAEEATEQQNDLYDHQSTGQNIFFVCPSSFPHDIRG